MRLEKGSLDRVAEVLVHNTTKDYFNCVAITGQVRMGKSNLAHQLAIRVYPQFDYEANYIGNPEHRETWKKLYHSPPKSVNWLDEAAKVLSSERRFEREQWYLQQLFNQFASHNKTILLCTPTFLEIDPRWRRSHITIWIHVFKRGKAVLMKNRFLQSTIDNWGLKSMQEKEMTMRAEDTKEERILANFDQNPSALFYFDFPDWKPEEKAVYEKYKQESQAKLEKEFAKWDRMQDATAGVPRIEMALARVSSYLHWKYGISHREIGRLAGFTDEKIRNSEAKFLEMVADGTIGKEFLPSAYFPESFIIHAKNMVEGKTI